MQGEACPLETVGNKVGLGNSAWALPESAPPGRIIEASALLSPFLEALEVRRGSVLPDHGEWRVGQGLTAEARPWGRAKGPLSDVLGSALLARRENRAGLGLTPL